MKEKGGQRDGGELILQKHNNKYLGTLCKRGHNYNGTGMSLRRTSNRSCIECVAELQKERRGTNKGSKKNREYAKKYYNENPQKFIDRQAKRMNAMSKQEKKQFYKKAYRSNRINRIEAVKKSRLKNYSKAKLSDRYSNIRGRNFKEVIQWAQSLPEKKCKEVIAIIEILVEFKVKILNSKHLIRTGEVL